MHRQPEGGDRRRERVLFVTSEAPFGNGEVWAVREMRAMAEAGVDVLVVPRSTRGGRPTGEGALLSVIATPLIGLGIAMHFVERLLKDPARIASIILWTLSQSISLWDGLKGLLVIPKGIYVGDKLRNAGISHIHAHSTTTVAVLAATIAARTGKPWSFTLHSSSILIPRYQRKLQVQMRSAVLARCVSRTIAERLDRFLGRQFTAKIRAVHLGAPSRPSAPLRGLGPITVVTPAVLEDHKGHKFAIAACQLLSPSEVQCVRWYFCGRGSREAALRQMVKDAGLRECIVFEGYIPNDALLQRYAAGEVDLVVLPSIAIPDGPHEGIPFCLIEAMASGVPVIATDTGSTAELVGGGAGILVPSATPQALAEAIRALIANPTLRSAMGHQGRRRVREEFSEERSISELLSCFSALRGECRAGATYQEVLP